MAHDTSIIFVVDPPALVIESILLIASIRRHLGQIDVVCYCPREKRDLLAPQFVEFAAHQGVTIDYIEADARFVPAYPHGNKLAAAKRPRRTAKTLFLDTDTVIWQGFDVDAMIRDNVLSVAPEGRRTWGKSQFGEDWGYLYDKFRLPVPTEQIGLARTGALSLPYFNAGVVGFTNAIVGAGEGADTGGQGTFGALWLETAVAIDQDAAVPKRRPWVDQIALPIALGRAGWSYDLLPNAWNLSLSRHSKAPAEEIAKIDAEDARILHYHRFRFLEETRYAGYFDRLVSDVSVFADFEEMMQPFEARSKDVAALETEIKAIRKMPKEARTDEIKVLFAQMKEKRMGLVKSNKQELFAQWPQSIVRR